MAGVALWLLELLLVFWMVYGVAAACEQEVTLGPVQLRGWRATLFGLAVAAASLSGVYLLVCLFAK
ncbi:MAG: hypothetical protein U0797_20195 [Gemmataceae bacterium]